MIIENPSVLLSILPRCNNTRRCTSNFLRTLVKELATSQLISRLNRVNDLFFRFVHKEKRYKPPLIDPKDRVPLERYSNSSRGRVERAIIGNKSDRRIRETRVRKKDRERGVGSVKEARSIGPKRRLTRTNFTR